DSDPFTDDYDVRGSSDGRTPRSSHGGHLMGVTLVITCHGAMPVSVIRGRATGFPPFQMRTMARVAVMSLSGSPVTSTRSARRPGAMRPRSLRRKARAG